MVHLGLEGLERVEALPAMSCRMNRGQPELPGFVRALRAGMADISMAPRPPCLSAPLQSSIKTFCSWVVMSVLETTRQQEDLRHGNTTLGLSVRHLHRQMAHGQPFPAQQPQACPHLAPSLFLGGSLHPTAFPTLSPPLLLPTEHLKPLSCGLGSCRHPYP